MKSILFSLFFGLLLVLTGCYQLHSDDELRTIPVTNNPNIVPQRGSPLPTPSI